MIVVLANIVMGLCALVFIGVWPRAFYHQWFKRGTWRGLYFWTLVGMLAGGLFMLVAWLSEPYR